MAHDLPVLRELLLLAGVSLAVVLVFQRLRIPALIGFVVTGILIGPGGLRLVSDPRLVQSMAEIGVVLLLFTVGLEFSLSDVRRMGRLVFVAAVLQMLATITVVALVLLAAGLHPARALFFGCLVAISSSAVILKVLSDRGELGSPHGRTGAAIAIVQDLAVILFALATPLLGRWLNGSFAVPAFTLSSALGALALVVSVALVFGGARRAVPWLLLRASSGAARETFLFAVLLVALGGAWLASLVGISLALGAFLAGLLLSESDLRPRVVSDVLPFRDALASVFFIAIGMSFHPRAVLAAPVLLLGATVGVVMLKALATLAALRVAGLRPRQALTTALVLVPIGEFSFVLAQAGQPAGLLGEAGTQAFVASAVFSMLLAPWLAGRGPEWALALQLRRSSPSPSDAADEEPAPRSDLLSDHVVIGGYGLNGHNLARVLRSTRVKHLVVDLDGRAVRDAAADGSPSLAGDITMPAILRQAGVARARVLVLALSDPAATRQACRVARSLSRDVFLLVRTRYVTEIDGLHDAGADQVIPEEFETSIEIFTTVLQQFHVPTNILQAQVRLLRQERYSLLRGRKLPGEVVEQLDVLLAEGTTDTFLLLQHSPAVGQTIAGLGLAGPGGPRAIAVVRGGTAITALDDALRLRAGDTLVLLGTHAEMDRAFQRLRAHEGPML